jgi:DNA-binding MarR family transcriptional regulator
MLRADRSVRLGRAAVVQEISFLTTTTGSAAEPPGRPVRGVCRGTENLHVARRCSYHQDVTPDRRFGWRTDLSQPGREDFARLLAFRVSLRRFQRWSEDQAAEAGLTHVQHQLLVAVKGHPGDIPPSIGELADYLLLRHHSAVELVDRAESAGLVRRVDDPQDARVVRVELTRKGDRLVTDLTEAHLAELHQLAAALNELVAVHDET